MYLYIIENCILSYVRLKTKDIVRLKFAPAQVCGNSYRRSSSEVKLKIVNYCTKTGQSLDKNIKLHFNSTYAFNRNKPQSQILFGKAAGFISHWVIMILKSYKITHFIQTLGYP